MEGSTSVLLYQLPRLERHELQAGGATVYVMLVEVVTHWIIFLPLTYVFGVVLGGGLIGAWMALPVYIIAYTTLNFLKFRTRNWITVQI